MKIGEINTKRRGNNFGTAKNGIQERRFRNLGLPIDFGRGGGPRGWGGARGPFPWLGALGGGLGTQFRSFKGGNQYNRRKSIYTGKAGVPKTACGSETLHKPKNNENIYGEKYTSSKSFRSFILPGLRNRRSVALRGKWVYNY